MPEHSMVPHLVRALYDDAIALVREARDLMTAGGFLGDGTSAGSGANIAAMPLVASLVRMVAELAEFRNSVERGGAVPRFARAATADGSDAASDTLLQGRVSASLKSLAARYARIERRHAQLRQALGHRTPSANAPPRATSEFPLPGLDADRPITADESDTMRALVVDDDGVYCLLVRQALEASGWTVDEALDGQMGWQMFQLAAYDLVVTDIFMPVQEGLETIRLMRRHRPATLIVAMSGGGSSGLGSFLEVARRLGADRAIAKPFRPSDLQAEIRSVYGGGRADAAAESLQGSDPPR